MADRISTLPDSVICYILSFLLTKDAVATCVLSKRWKPLWRSVPTLDFECDCHPYSNKEIKFGFVQSINAFVHSRDIDQSLQRFHLRCYSSYYHTTTCNPTNVYQLVTDAVQHKLEYLDLSLPCTNLPSVVFSCKTLVEFQLMFSSLKAFSSVDLPLLKILHLHHVFFSEYRFIAELLSGCPNLEDMELNHLSFTSYAIEAKFKKLPKLILAVMDKDLIPLEVVYNVQFLRLNWMDKEEVEIIEDLIPKFHNLTRVEFRYLGHNRNWMEVLKVLEHCPKLQNLIIDQGRNIYNYRRKLQLPLCVPECISSHLITCCLNNYGGYETEFEFARYIMQNAKLLQDMTIRSYRGTNRKKKLEMIGKLSLCIRFSSTCKLLFS